MKYSHGIARNNDVNNAIVRQLNDRILVYFINGRLFSRKASRND